MAIYLPEFCKHALGGFPAVARAVHGVVDDEVVGAVFVDDGGVDFAPVLSEVLGHDCQVLGLFVGGHCCLRAGFAGRYDLIETVD